MIRAIIIEDEEKARKNLLALLNEYCGNVEVLSMEGTVKAGIEAIKKYFKGEGGYVKMSDDSSVIVSRRKKEEFLKKFSKI
ncbi:MAG: hypothetical protein ABII90_08460 [Bacteroidota bacterium]